MQMELGIHKIQGQAVAMHVVTLEVEVEATVVLVVHAPVVYMVLLVPQLK